MNISSLEEVRVLGFETDLFFSVSSNNISSIDGVMRVGYDIVETSFEHDRLGMTFLSIYLN